MLIDFICRKSLLEREYVIGLIEKASSHYFRFSIPKTNGGSRTIHRPSNELKAIQRIVHDSILAKLPNHDAAMAYKKGCNIHSHAMTHSGKKFVLRMDFKNFFSSISDRDVSRFANAVIKNSIDGWTDIDTEYFSKLVCFKGNLVMGAVTSPSLTNAMCFELDRRLSEASSEKLITYTRYSDDLYFSTDVPGVLRKFEIKVKQVLSDLKNPSSLSINSSKTYHSSKKRKVMVTGLVLTNEGVVSVGRDKKREIRSYIFNWDKIAEEKRVYLSGYLSYLGSVEPEFINSICQKYGAELIRRILSFNTKNSN